MSTAENEAQADEKAIPLNASWRNFDFVGSALLVASLTGFLVPISWGGIVYAWDSWHTLVPLILSATGLACWLVFEAYIPAAPIIPLSIFRHRTTCLAFAGTFALGIIQFGLVFYLPLYYQVVKGYSPLISGVALLPETLLSGPTTAITGVIVSKTGKYRALIAVGWVMMALGCGLLLQLRVHSTIPQWVFLNVPAGLGIGSLFATLSVASQAPVRETEVVTAAGLSPFIRALGQAVGIAVS